MKILLRVRGSSADSQLAEQVRNRANLALGSLSTHITSVLVRLEDVNGPKGGIDKRCSIELSGTFGQRVANIRDQSFEPRSIGPSA